MNKKVLTGSILGLMLLVATVYAVSYFHQTQVDLTVSEARSSADMPYSLSCVSGDTESHNLTIHNAGRTTLNALLTWAEDTNTGVNYTTNLPLTVSLSPTADTIVEVQMTCDPLTDAGSVNGTILYQKI